MPGKHKKKKGIRSYQKKSPYSYSVDHDKEMVYIKDNSSGKTYSESYSKYPDLTQGARDFIMDQIRSSKKKGVKSYSKSKKQKFSALESMVKAPRKIKPEGKPEEELIYANQEEIQMLKRAGGSGTPTQFGVRSYEEKKSEEETEQFNPSANYTDNTNTTISKTGGNLGQGGSIGDLNEGDSDNDTDTDSDDEKPTFNTSNITETSAYTGKPLTLKELYDNQDDLSSLLSKKQSSTRTETRTVPSGYKNSGDKYTVTITEEGDPLSDTVNPENFEFLNDKEGNIIGWYDGEGTPQFEKRDEWYVDSDGNWFFVGEGAMEGVGAGGSGETTILTADGSTKTVGARTYADLIGFEQTLLDDAIADRQQNIAELKAREEDYGGVYQDSKGKRPGESGFDASTATFRGGRAQDMYDKADQYTSAYDQMLADATGYTIDPVTGEYKKTETTEFDRLTEKAEDEYTRLSGDAESRLREGDRRSEEYAGQARDQAMRASQLGSQAADLAMDSEFYGGLQRQTDAVQRDQQAYRGRIQEMADSAGVTPRSRQSALYAMRSEQIDRDSDAQGKQMQQMLTERGISPTSPIALRMMNNIKSGTATQKREARRQALFDAMQMQDAENQQRAGLFAQASGMAGQELGTIGQKAGIRSGRIGDIQRAQSGVLGSSEVLSRLGAASSADALARAQAFQGLASDRGQFYAGLGSTKMSTALQGAGMQAAQSSQMFSRGTYFGNQAQNINQLRLADAMDRQAGQEYKKLTGMSMDLSKYGIDKQEEIQKKLMDLQSSYKSGGSGSNLIGQLVGAGAGYFLSGGNPYMAGLGAQAGGSLIK